jgi:hypothetical protein
MSIMGSGQGDIRWLIETPAKRPFTTSLSYSGGSRQMTGMRESRFALRRRIVYVTSWYSDSLERF